MQITTNDIRHAYIKLHGLTHDSINEYERLGLLTADGYSDELLSLPIDEFMVAAGFVAEDEKLTPSERISYPATGKASPASVIKEVLDVIEKSVIVKRQYNRKGK